MKEARNKQYSQNDSHNTRLGLCVNQGIRHYLSQMKTSIKRSAPFGLIFMVVCVAMVLLAGSSMSVKEASLDTLLAQWPWFVTAIIIGGLAECGYYTSQLPLLQETDTTSFNDKKKYWCEWAHLYGRTLKAVVLNLIVWLLPLILFLSLAVYQVYTFEEPEDAIEPFTLLDVLKHHALTLGLSGTVVLLIWICCVPLTYVTIRYLLTPKGSILKMLGKHYGHAMRHYGFIFAVNLLSFIFIMLLSVVICLPFYILCTAFVLAYQGMAFGDPITLPSYFKPLLIIITAIMSWAQLIIRSQYLYILKEVHFETLPAPNHEEE